MKCCFFWVLAQAALVRRACNKADPCSKASFVLAGSLDSRWLNQEFCRSHGQKLGQVGRRVEGEVGLKGRQGRGKGTDSTTEGL